MMRIYDRLPVLKGLSCGDRIAYARQFRGMTQQKLGEAIGLTKEKVRNRVCRYEKGGRIPKPERIQKIAEILNVSEAMLKNYDFRDPSDLVYETLWIEELIPELYISLHKGNPMIYETCECFALFYKQWRKMQIKREKDEISKRDYIEWKLTYEAPRGKGGM